VVARRFNLADILLMKKLQKQGVYLDLETALLWSPAPLWVALTDYFSLNEARGSTFVVDDSFTGRPMKGFLQAWDRADRLACDVICLAPSLRASSAAFQVWYDLLEHLCLDKGERRMQRIFARLLEDETGIDVFRQLGFSAYARRQIFRLEQLPSDLHPSGTTPFRPLERGHAWGVQQLRSSLAPRLVRQAEGEIKEERDFGGLLPWWKARRIKEYVLADGDEIQAYVRIVLGEKGHWLRIMLRPEAAQEADRILSEALLMAPAYPSRPICCSLREYEAGLRGALGELGFQPFASELLMVKQLTVTARVPVGKLGTALDKPVETATPISKSDSCKEALLIQSECDS
jgi:hypothetical protein